MAADELQRARVQLLQPAPEGQSQVEIVDKKRSETMRVIGVLILLGATMLSGCGAKHLPKLAVCSGEHKRPANPNGSILPVLPLPQPATATEPKVSIASHPYFGSC